MEPPRTAEAVRLILVMKRLQDAFSTLDDMGRCPSAQVLILQAAQSVKVAYQNEQQGGRSW